MIKTKLFVHIISPTEETPIKIDDQINEWVENTGHEVLDVSLTSNIADINGKEIIRAIVRYKESEELEEEIGGGIAEDESEEKKEGEEAKGKLEEDEIIEGYIDDL